MVGSYLISLNKLNEQFQYKKVMSYGVVVKKNEDFSNLEITWKDKKIKVFYNEDFNIKDVNVGDLVKVRGTFKEYNGKEQIFADFILKVEINPKLLEKVLDFVEKEVYELR